MSINKRIGLLFGSLVMFSSGYNCVKNFQKHVWPVQVSGIIVQKDSIGKHETPSISIKESNGKVLYWGLDGLDAFWNALKIDDSIFKPKNSYAFKIVRKDTTLTFYPICDCCDTLR